ncbi:Histone-lysine N-methyltransferase SETMAR [Ooceraea biroi]|uniref:Histone-lysine N-methyltransferase SETMAR n=1 Tax=Ooceraea biroi TaxID=2015173 RepID=A0A026VTY4_OOCBI|nr:Histone-lysine N-methyltransferase SETMAR [Ooceraea biroi]
MENQKQHFPHIAFYYFRKEKNAVQAHTKLCDVYGEDALKLRQCQNWFTKFRSGDFNVKDAPRSGRPIEIDDDKRKALIDSNRRLTTREIAENLNISKSSVENHSKRLGSLKRRELVNRKGVAFHHDNARPRTSLVTREKLLQLGWDVLPHPPYSPDLAPSDYHSFRSLQNALNGKTLTADEDIKSLLELFFAEKDKNLFERGIMKLPEKWQKIIKQNGQYIV